MQRFLEQNSWENKKKWNLLYKQKNWLWVGVLTITSREERILGTDASRWVNVVVATCVSFLVIASVGQ